jgi:hypothetical protein
MVWHDDERERLQVARIVLTAQRLDHFPAQIKIDKHRLSTHR